MARGETGRIMGNRMSYKKDFGNSERLCDVLNGRKTHRQRE